MHRENERERGRGRGETRGNGYTSSCKATVNSSMSEYNQSRQEVRMEGAKKERTGRCSSLSSIKNTLLIFCVCVCMCEIKNNRLKK